MNFLLVFIGSGIGGVMRYAAALALNGRGAVWGTLAVNVVGSFLIGAFGALSANARLLLTIGLCGGFTTFSTFSNECLSFIRAGAYLPAAGYVAASVALGLAAVALGWMCFR